jgi:putative transposase
MKLLAEIETLKKEHPFWGYRRIWAYLRFRMGRKINHKRM